MIKLLSLTLSAVAIVSLNGCKKTSAPETKTTASPTPTDQRKQPAGGNTAVREIKYFKGSIGSTLDLQMKLIRDGDKLSGSYFYQKIGTRIDLRGTVDNGGLVNLEEFDQGGKPTGSFKGIWKADNEDGLISIAGNWTKPDGGKKIAFSLHQEPIDLSEGAEIVAKAIKEHNKKLQYEIDIEYPQVTGPAVVRFDKFNQEARNLVARKAAEFRKDMAERAKDEQEGPTESSASGSDLGIGYTISIAKDDLISIEFNIGGYYRGAAHPNSYTEVLNYDVTAAKVLKLADLFKPGSKYLPAISSYCIKDLKRQAKSKGADSMLDDSTIESGAAAEAKNFKSWTIRKSGLGITFDAYQVGPYAAGPQSVFVPYSALKDSLKPDGPLAQFKQ